MHTRLLACKVLSASRFAEIQVTALSCLIQVRHVPLELIDCAKCDRQPFLNVKQRTLKAFEVKPDHARLRASLLLYRCWIHTVLAIMASIARPEVVLLAIAAPVRPQPILFVKNQNKNGQMAKTAKLTAVTAFMIFCTLHT